jgi:hypothetical protein
MKKNAKPGQRISRTQSKIFSGIPYDYKVQFTVIRDIVSISYWRAAHTTKPVKKPVKPPIKFPRYGFWVIVFLLVFLAAVVYLYPFFLPDGVPWYPGSPPANTSEIPTTELTPLQTENFTPTPAAIQGNDYQQSPKTSSYSYYSENNRKFISFTTYGGLSDYFSKMRHTAQPAPEKEAITDHLENDYQDEYLQPFIEKIRQQSPDNDDPAKLAISLVQHMPNIKNTPYNPSSEGNHPYETLYSNRGTSSDKSLLSAYLLKELGYETVLFEYPGHMAVGVKCSPDYDFYDTGYAFIETTVPTIITYISDSNYGGVSVSANPHIIHVNEGKRVMDVSREYRDAVRLKQLERMGGVLNQSEYTEWLKITNRYDLQYTA